MDVIGNSGRVPDQEAREVAKSKILEEFGKKDVSINAAYANMSGAKIGIDQTVFDLKMEDFQKVSGLNLDCSVVK